MMRASPLYECMDIITYLPAQQPSLQSVYDDSFPGHLAPLQAGLGLLQNLQRDFVPSPQVTEQFPQLPQVLHPPSTEQDNVFF